MRHSWGHEQTVETLYVSHRGLSNLSTASEERNHALVVIDTVLGRNQLIVPAVILQQLATALPKLTKVWIGCVHQRAVFGFSLKERLVACWFRKIECPPIPVRIAEDEPLVVRDWNR